jgi:hypothetical protein
MKGKGREAARNALSKEIENSKVKVKAHTSKQTNKLNSCFLMAFPTIDATLLLVK